MNKTRDALDHPLFFLLVITLGVMAMSSLLTWGAKATGYHGVAAVAQHP